MFLVFPLLGLPAPLAATLYNIVRNPFVNLRGRFLNLRETWTRSIRSDGGLGSHRSDLEVIYFARGCNNMKAKRRRCRCAELLRAYIKPPCENTARFSRHQFRVQFTFLLAYRRSGASLLFTALAVRTSDKLRGIHFRSALCHRAAPHPPARERASERARDISGNGEAFAGVKVMKLGLRRWLCAIFWTRRRAAVHRARTTR